MKKMISMVMAAAMVATLVPANAFAAVKPEGDVPATVKVLGTKDNVQDKDFAGRVPAGPEVQIKIGKTSYATADTADQTKYKFTVKLDNADFDAEYAPELIINEGTDAKLAATKWEEFKTGAQTVGQYDVVMERVADDEMDVTLTGKANADLLEEDEYITIKLGAEKSDNGATVMDKYSDGKSASVAVTSKDLKLSNDNTDLTYITVGSKGIKASVKKTVDIAEDDLKEIEKVTIEPAVGDTFANMFKDNADAKIRVRVTNGFEFKNYEKAELNGVVADADSDENELIFPYANAWETAEELDLTNVVLDSKSAKDGAVATLKIYATGCDTVSVEVAKVIGSDVTLSVDKDEDVPVIYSGVDVKNTGLTDDSDHMSLEVTLKEAAPGVWNTSKDFTLTLPEGVYVVDDKKGATVEGIDVKTHDGVKVNGDTALSSKDAIEEWMADAYKNGDYLKFDFDKRTLKQTDPATKDDEIELSFKLQLVADPNFVGDVTLKLEGAAVETQEVTIAKFVKPYTVEAKQNDLSIDYRNTKVPTDVVIKEAEAGLWDKGTDIILSLDKIDFDEKGTVTVDEKSGLKVKDDKLKKTTVGEDNNKAVQFTVDTISGDEPAVVTISGMELYMDRSLPAGAYDLEVTSDKMHKNGYDKQYVASTDADDKDPAKTAITEINEDYVDYVEKAGFITITTAGREDADSFTTKVTVPIGGTTITAGGSTIDVDTPAYINAAGYTMLPLRAVAVALGIPSTSVMWNGEARSITIMYGSKVISMTIGQKTMYVNGSPVAMSAAPEITNSRTFLPFRDLGVALGVSDITFEKDPATSKVTTVYFNAGK